MHANVAILSSHVAMGSWFPSPYFMPKEVSFFEQRSVTSTSDKRSKSMAVFLHLGILLLMPIVAIGAIFRSFGFAQRSFWKMAVVVAPFLVLGAASSMLLSIRGTP